ncbi:hypothetical protein NC653_021948 [Populus alba x Populus x berolinensis]|uniref:Uncharacterized protein n=1 Tax=Populus alba x Populus x berolinensis TaxID=444605 RepID=A0AAD6QF32_9ROSI|nr:hypothetical protein NC653_021948 [Populus alba x Populus x berolinensis]
MLVHQYKLFKMLSNESITNMFTRMTNITNNLDALSRTYTIINNIRKLLRLSSKTWETKVTTI